MSVDLVGSTEFKARFGEAQQENVHPAWVNQIRHFYREFPKFVSQRYARLIANAGDGFNIYDACFPCTWKTIGDEILFCCRVETLEHLAFCARAFLAALDDYGWHLDGGNTPLDVKGSGWIASFPAPNISVEVQSGVYASDQIDEDFEKSADKHPEEYDFLGKGMDSGFRAARHASADRFSPSAELAWLLCEAAHHNVFPHQFVYHGREVLKGVIQDHPYPIISIDCERSASRREVKERERAITKDTYASAINLRDFLKAFMTEEGMDLPVLARHGSVLSEGELPESYRRFQKSWAAVVKETVKRVETEVEAAEAEAAVGELPDAVSAGLDNAVARTDSGA